MLVTNIAPTKNHVARYTFIHAVQQVNGSIHLIQQKMSL